MVPPPRTQVLVVGAGPNGLVCASTLASIGVEVMIIDKLPRIKNGARAAVVHAGTLEVLESIGMASPLLALGIHSKGITFYGAANKLLDVDITLLRNQTQFPLTLLLPQHEIERVFQESLAARGIEVLRGRQVMNMNETSENGGLEVSLDDGSTILAKYVVGADGSRSTIRRLAGIDFRDPHTGVPYDCDVDPSSVLQMVFSDIYLQEPIPKSLARDVVSWHLDKHLLLCPLPMETPVTHGIDKTPASFWRIGMIVPTETPSPPKHPDVQYLQRELDARKPWNDRITISSVVTGATYRLRSAVAGTFYKKIGGGNVLLVGDAAHVHSPSGAQGMNLGLCDAVALGHAIRSHIKNSAINRGNADDTPLVTYSTSRRITAIKVIGMVKKLTAIIKASTGWQRVIRNILLWLAGRLVMIKWMLAWRMSGLVHRDD